MTSTYSNAAACLENTSGTSLLKKSSNAFKAESSISRSINELETAHTLKSNQYKGKDQPRAKNSNGHTWDTQQPKPKFVAHKTPKTAQKKESKESN